MARVDVRATAASGVWRSPQPLPLAHLAATVNACDSGDVLIFWTQPINVAPPPAGVAADGSLGIGQAATFDTGLTNRGTVYVCDSGGAAIDVLIAGSDQPLAASPAPPSIGPLQLAQDFLTQRAETGWYSSPFLPIPPGTVSVLVAFDFTASPGPIEIKGAITGIVYYQGPVANKSDLGKGGIVVCQVSSVNDSGLVIRHPALAGVLSGSMIPLQTPYVPQPLAVTIVT